MFIKAENLNEAFIALSRALVESGVNVTRRGFQCREIPSAVLIEITNPIDRYVRIPERKWNKTLGWIESLWIARGDNCLDMPAAYVKNLKTFSDDGEFMRAGYGPRIRRYGDNDGMLITTDGRRMRRQYKNGKSGNRKEPSMYQNVTDQLRFVVEKFKEDIDTREAAITIHDPISDDFDGSADYSVDAGGLPLLKTKDTPCTRSIHFMVVNGKMNCYVDMRSNDCFTYNTKIPLLNGEVWELGRLAEEKFDEKFWVYSRDENGRIVPGLAHHPRKVRRVSEIMKITLDNGEVIECTPDHRFMLLNGEYKEVKDIEIGESLSPLYRRHNDKGYEEIFYHDRWEKTHIISKEILKKECDVYDLTVDKYHNFALESGVFVHNCVWGFSAVNVFNFTLMQEYIAAMVGVPVGSYFHKADNLHVYQEFLPLVEQVAKKEIGTFPSGTNFTYTPTYKSLKEFDYLIKQLSSFESMCREGVVSKNELRGALDSMFQDELFSDWAKVIFRYWTKETVEFKNPLLNELFN